MRYKLFTSVLFPNKKLIFLYFILLSASTGYVMSELGAEEINTIPVKAVLGAFISLLVLLSMLMYVIKGLDKKLRILKAIGVPEGYMMSTYCIGFGVFAAAVSLFDFVFIMKVRNLSVLSVLLWTVSVGAGIFLLSFISFAVVSYMTKR